MSNYEPVKVSIGVENPSLERGAFYNICFITENDTAPRTLRVDRLSDLLENGYSRLDLAYNFCVGVFSQQSMGTVYIRAKRSFESYVEAYNSDDNSMYYFVVLQTKDLTDIEKFNNHLVSSDEMKLQFFSQNVGSKILKSPKLVNYYQDFTLSGGVPVESKDYYLNKAYSGVTVVSKMPLPDYLLGGYGNTAVYYGVKRMVGKEYIWEIDKPNRQIRYARSVIESGWVGSREMSTINNSEVTVVATKGKSGKLLRASIIDPKVKVETISSQLLKGLGKEVLDYAIPLIDPEAKDWVLDPENNAVEIKEPVGGFIPYKCNYDECVNRNPVSLADLKAAFLEDKKFSSGSGIFEVRGDSPNTTVWFVIPNYGNYNVGYQFDDGLPIEPLRIPIDEVSEKIISNAESGHLESKEFLKSIPLFAYLLTGSGTEAVNKAVLDINAEATDWVLDPDNNRIRYTASGDVGGIDAQCNFDGKAITASALCAKNGATVVSISSTGSVLCSNNMSYSANCTDVVNIPPNEQYIPIDTVAAKVIANAESGHTPSQEALRLSTVERVDIGEYDEALEAASIEIDTSWKYLPIYDVAVQVKWNSIAGHAESIEAVNNSLPFELPDNDTPWDFVPEETSVTGSTTTIKAKRTFENQKLKSSITVAASDSKVGEYLIKGGGADNWKSIPIDTVAAQVISNAEASHAPSQEAVKATALEGFVAGEYDADLDAAAVIDN